MASDREKRQDKLLIVGYGSLLSGYGLLAARRGGASALVADEAFPVALRNARRGLAKPSSHGRYLAMDLEPIDRAEPIVGRAGSFGGSGEIGALGLLFDRRWIPAIARREEYSADKLAELVGIADRAGEPVGDLLMRLAERTRFDLLAYRTELRAMLGYTSPGYVFHPLPFEDGRVALVAIGSGYEGSGDPSVISRRREFGIDRLHTLGEAMESRGESDRDGQIGYVVECLLGGVHGLNVVDLIDGIRLDSEWGRDLRDRFASQAREETGMLMRATAMDEARYQDRFSREPHPCLARLLSD